MSDLIIVEKFGGGGSQSAAHIERNVEHFIQDPNIEAAVFSGPGGSAGRATDRMIRMTELHAADKDHGELLNEIEQQFAEITPDSASALISPALDEIKRGFENGYGYSWLKARPEYFTTNVYGFLLNEAGVEVNIVNPVGAIFADEHGRLNTVRTLGGLSKALRPDMLNLVPGFSAMDPEWNMVNISRGSTDIVAAVTGRTYKQLYPRAQVDVILRKDDVHGILRAGPKIKENAEIATELSIPEVETLALGGAEVVHPAVMSLIDGTGVHLLVRNTFDLDHSGTAIVPVAERVIDHDRPVVGIAGKSVVAYKWREQTTDALPGSIEAVSSVFTNLGIPITEIQSSSGGLVEVYVSEQAAREYDTAIRNGLMQLNGSKAEVTAEADLELVVLAGEALRESSSMLRVASELERAAEISGAKVKGFWSTGGEPNLYVTVPRDSSKEFMAKLYDIFIDSKSK